MAGLEHGADDDLGKPFAFAELDARLRALARRLPLRALTAVRIDNFVLDFAARTVTRAGRLVALTAKEYALLERLAEHPGRITSRHALSSHLWNAPNPASDNLLDVLVRRVRRKLDEGHAVPLIHTVRGMGYRLGA